MFGMQVVEEYRSDLLASILEDEKKLKKAKEAVDRKRKAKQESKRVEDKRQKTFHASTKHCYSGRRWAFVLNPSVSVQPRGKKRLILDLRHMNECLIKYRFRYEDCRVTKTYLEKDAYMFSFDLKSGYGHIEIASEQEKLWAFSWKFHQAEGFAFRSFNSTLHFHRMCSSFGEALAFAGG